MIKINVTEMEWKENGDMVLKKGELSVYIEILLFRCLSCNPSSITILQ